MFTLSTLHVALADKVKVKKSRTVVKRTFQVCLLNLLKMKKSLFCVLLAKLNNFFSISVDDMISFKLTAQTPKSTQSRILLSPQFSVFFLKNTFFHFCFEGRIGKFWALKSSNRSNGILNNKTSPSKFISFMKNSGHHLMVVVPDPNWLHLPNENNNWMN